MRLQLRYDGYFGLLTSDAASMHSDRCMSTADESLQPVE